jgi:ABC-type uncharacterized transport system permease subunit
MPEPATSIPLIIATLASGLAFVLTAKRLRIPEDQRAALWPVYALLALITALCFGSFVYRVVVVHQAWAPVQAHVDGLLLIALLLAPAILYIQSRPKLFGLSLFAMPLLTLILLWGVCATLWTYRPFSLDSFTPAWTVFHLATTYVGLLGCGIGAAGGAMYLFVQGRLKAKAGLGQVNPMASLETLETLIVRAATLGFVLLTLSLISGLVMVTQSDEATSLGKSWWSSPKVWLAASAWVVYAVLINVRSFSTVRGRRAAWLAIAGLFLVLATYGAVEALDRSEPTADVPLGIEPNPEEDD